MPSPPKCEYMAHRYLFTCCSASERNRDLRRYRAIGVAENKGKLSIRMALGATESDISRIVLWEGGRLVLIGIAIGIPVSFAASSLIRTLLFGVSPDDSTTRITVFGTLVIMVLTALIVPLWRALHVEPQTALREI